MCATSKTAKWPRSRSREIVWSLGVHQAGVYENGKRYIPTNVAFAPTAASTWAMATGRAISISTTRTPSGSAPGVVRRKRAGKLTAARSLVRRSSGPRIRRWSLPIAPTRACNISRSTASTWLHSWSAAPLLFQHPRRRVVSSRFALAVSLLDCENRPIVHLGYDQAWTQRRCEREGLRGKPEPGSRVDLSIRTLQRSMRTATSSSWSGCPSAALRGCGTWRDGDTGGITPGPVTFSLSFNLRTKPRASLYSKPDLYPSFRGFPGSSSSRRANRVGFLDHAARPFWIAPHVVKGFYDPDVRLFLSLPNKHRNDIPESCFTSRRETVSAVSNPHE